ncbi:WWOX [Symbiodinium sp. KB8]|nr:WWOX [Symbiodinium sp. KB8]
MGPYARYGAAKLANLIFSHEINRRLGHLGVYSNAVHPGVVATEMLRRANFEAMLGSLLGSLAFQAAQLRNRLFAYGAQEAALNLLFCAAAPEVEAELKMRPAALKPRPGRARQAHRTHRHGAPATPCASLQ